jgi:glutaredoxin
MKKGIFLSTGFAIIMWVSLANGEIYKWTDESGKVHFSDTAPESVETQQVQLEVNSLAFPEVEEHPGSALSAKEVVLYSTTWCGFCKKARKFFRSKGIAFKEYDVENSVKGRRDYAKLGGGGVPIILVGNRRLNGFSADRFMSVYRSRPSN